MDQIYRNLELIANLKISNFKTKPDNIRYKLCTIYVLRNKINGKVYIGQTYKSPKDRWSDHKSQAITKSTKGYFQKAICKYSWESFDKYVIWQCECDVLDSKWILNNREKFFIKLFKSNMSKFGYNSTDGGEGSIGHKMTQESKIKMSKSKKGKFNGKWSKSVFQFDLNFNLIKEWPSAAEIERQLGFDAKQIADCCNLKQHSCKGFLWCWKTNYVKDYFIINQIKVKVVSADKSVLQFDLNGNLVKEWPSLSSAWKELNLDGSGLSKSVYGKFLNQRRKQNNWIWILKSNFSEKLLQERINILKVTWNSIQQQNKQNV